MHIKVNRADELLDQHTEDDAQVWVLAAWADETNAVVKIDGTLTNDTPLINGSTIGSLLDQARRERADKAQKLAASPRSPKLAWDEGKAVGYLQGLHAAFVLLGYDDQA